eukprot:2252520-Prymnesium_polylepis.1
MASKLLEGVYAAVTRSPRSSKASCSTCTWVLASTRRTEANHCIRRPAASWLTSATVASSDCMREADNMTAKFTATGAASCSRGTPSGVRHTICDLWMPAARPGTESMRSSSAFADVVGVRPAIHVSTCTHEGRGGTCEARPWLVEFSSGRITVAWTLASVTAREFTCAPPKGRVW